MTTTRISRRELERIREAMSERDWAITRLIARHRFVTSIQLRRVFFVRHATQGAATRACIRVLDRLMALRIVTRLERRVGGHRHGSAAFIWCLDIIGDRLTRGSGAARRRTYEPSLTFLAHTLEVAETHVRLIEATRDQGPTLARVEIETEAWRPYLAPTGARTMLKPDLMISLRTPDYDDLWYLEVDLGSESLPVLLRKSHAYDDYRHTGTAQREHGIYPRVLWAMSSVARAQRLSAALVDEQGIPAGMFIVTTMENLLAELTGNPASGSEAPP